MGQADDGEIDRGFLVERGTKGFTAKDRRGKLSLRASVTSELVFEDVPAAEDAILPDGRASRARSCA